MKKKYSIWLLSLLALAVGCVQAPKRIEYAEYNDQITVQTALSLAKSSYVLGCVEAHKRLNKVAGANRLCIQEAEISVKENIIYILDQDGSQSSLHDK